jgi:hypothetical protein
MSTVPKLVKVIRKKDIVKTSIWTIPEPGRDKFYSSILDDRQYIYSFLNSRSSKNCYTFLKKYKEVNGFYPDLRKNTLKKIDENFIIYIDDEFYEGLKQRCLLNGVGLIGISNFEYTFSENIFNLHMSAVDLLKNENINCDQQIDNLNYLLDF